MSGGAAAGEGAGVGSMIPLGRPTRGSGLRGRAGAFLGGAVAGLLSGFLLARPGVMEKVGAALRGAGSGLTGAGRHAGLSVAGALGRLRSSVGAEEAPTERAGPDPHAVDAAVGDSPLASRVQARLLGRGVVEITGSATDADAVRDLERSLRALPGVDVVVDRVWVPGGGPGARGTG